jgi:hypothetical protein
VYNKTVPDDDFIKSKHVVIKTQVFLFLVLTDTIKSIYDLIQISQHLPGGTEENQEKSQDN